MSDLTVDRSTYDSKIPLTGQYRAIFIYNYTLPENIDLLV